MRSVSLSVPQPDIIAHYNRFMGGVDLCDQLRGTYNMEKAYRTKFWYKKLFLGILGMAVTNAFILYKNYLPTQVTSTGGRVRGALHATFTRELQSGLYLKGQKAKVRVAADDAVDRQSWKTGIFHHPVRDPEDRIRCVMCHLRGMRHDTYVYCAACRHYLCAPLGGRDCWHAFHTTEVLPARMASLSDVSSPKPKPRGRGRPSKKRRKIGEV